MCLLVAKQLSTSPQPCEKHSSCCYHLLSSRWTCTWSLPYRTEVFSSQASSGSWIPHSHCCSSCAKSRLILYLTVLLLQLTKMMFTFPIIGSGSYSFQTSSAFPGGSLLHEKERCFYISTYGPASQAEWLKHTFPAAVLASPPVWPTSARVAFRPRSAPTNASWWTCNSCEVSGHTEGTQEVSLL